MLRLSIFLLLAPVLAAQTQQLSLHDFEGPCSPGVRGSNFGNRAQPACATPGALRSDRAIHTAPFGAGCGLVLGPAQFVAAARGSTAYAANTLRVTVPAVGGAAVSAVRLCVTVGRQPGSLVDGFDVYADEVVGPGGDNFQTLLATVSLPPVTGAGLAVATVCVDLDGVALLQQQGYVDLRLNLFGSAKASAAAPTWFDDLLLTGTCGPCTSTGTVHLLGAAACAVGSTPLLTLPPLATNQATVVSFTTQYAGGVAFLLISPLSQAPPFALAPQGCTVFLDPTRTAMAGALPLDAAGNASFTLRLPKATSLVGLAFTSQGAVAHAAGLGFTDAYVAVIGCR